MHTPIPEIERLVDNKIDKITSWRRYIHAHPELSFREEETAGFIEGILGEAGIPNRRIAGTGILAWIEGGGDSSQAVVLRADTDALPLTEQTGVEFSSVNYGVMHACGHDMHTAALLGALNVIKSMAIFFEGTVIGLFQPGEELAPGGASLVLAQEPFAGYSIRGIIGQHVDGKLQTGTFGFHSGKFMASADEIHITIHGQGGHAAMREERGDPVAAGAEVVTALHRIVPEREDKTTPAVLSLGRFIADGATNVIPPEVTIEGTLRTFDEQWRMQARALISEVTARVAARYGCTAEVAFGKGYPFVYNDPDLTLSIRDRFEAAFGPDGVVEVEQRMTAEDFGYYSQRYPSLFYRLGVCGDEDPGRPHTATFRPDEKGLKHGTLGLVIAALKVLE